MKIAACLIVKDEARDIAEWIAYHALAGFDALLIYDNGSSDGTMAVLQAAAAFYDVRITPWRTPSISAQTEAYHHALRTNRAEFDWMAMIDSDEFVVVHKPDTLQSLCAANAAAIGINWAMFGTNGHIELPTCLVIESFTRRSEAAFSPNRHVKSFVRPSALPECLNPHAFAVHGPTILPDGRPLEWNRRDGSLQPGLTLTPPDYTVAQINHYFTRSRTHWARKAARGYRNPLSMLKLSQFDDYDRNEVEDTGALWAAADVHRARATILARALSASTAPPATRAAWELLQAADAVPAQPAFEPASITS